MPGGLHPSEGNLLRELRVRVDPACSGLDLASDARDLVGAAGVDGRGESVGRVVRDLDRFCLGLELDDAGDRAEDLQG